MPAKEREWLLSNVSNAERNTPPQSRDALIADISDALSSAKGRTTPASLSSRHAKGTAPLSPSFDVRKDPLRNGG